MSYADRRTRFGALVFDATLTEAVELEGGVTLFPVEDGSTISDHITQGPERLRLTGVVAIADVGSFEAGEDGRLKQVDVVEQCRRLHAARDVVEVSTGQMLFPDMGVERLRATRTSDGGGGNFVSIEAELVKVRKVTLRTAEVPEERRVAETDGAKGRAGQTNKAVGKNPGQAARAPNPADAGKPGSPLNGPVDPGESLLKAGQSGRGPVGWAFEGARGAFGGP